MPTVPGLLPSVAPTEVGTPSLRVSADSAAFGGAVGQGLQHLGEAVGHASNEIWQRAVALQQLRNESEAKEADAQYMIQSGKLHAEFSSLQGKAAVDAFPKYQEDLQAKRLEIRGGLKTEQSQKMYDASALAFMGRSIFNGAGHAAQQNKVYANGTSNARLDAQADYVLHNPNDGDAIAHGEIAIRNEVHTTQAPIHGWGDEQAQAAIKARISGLWKARLHGMAKEAPFEAQRMFDENKGKLYGEDLLKTEDFIRTQRDNVGSRVISQETNSISNEDGSQRTMKEVVDAAEKKAKAVSDDPIFLRNVENTTIGDYNKRRQITSDTHRQNANTVNEGVGKGPANLTELLKDPAVAKAYDALPPKERNAVPGIIRRYTESAKKESNERNFSELVGKQYSQEGREELLGLDPTTKDISQAQVRQVWALQEKIRKSNEGSPQVNRALGWLRQSYGAQLEALGVYKRTETTKDDYDKFMGSLSTAVEAWQETTGKPPTAKDIKDTIGPALIKEKVSSWYQFWKTDEPAMFKVQPTAEEIQRVKDAELAAGRPEPDDATVLRGIRQATWKKLFKPKLKAGPEGAVPNAE